ncbi:MAG: YlbF family regulator [Firmicutes bacterium]|nr:YlbF family regulator [Bacillota bacterium]
MNVYDEAHSLARSLRGSVEFQTLLKAREALDAEPEKLKRVQDLKIKEIELQARVLAGEKVSQERMEALRQMIDILLLDPTVRSYLEAEGRFTRLFTDIQKIIADAVKEWEPLVQPRTSECDAKETDKHD